MNSTSEKGHAKNLSSAQLLINVILQFGTVYNPSNPLLFLSNLQAIFNNALNKQALVNSLLPAYTYAVDNREKIGRASCRERVSSTV